MLHDQLLAEIQAGAHLHGPREARRVMRAVSHTLSDIVPGSLVQALLHQFPADPATPAGPGRPTDPATPADSSQSRPAGEALPGCRAFIRRLAQRLMVDEASAAFLARVTLAQLNVFCTGVTPAMLAATAPADLGPLLRALPSGMTGRPATTALSVRIPAPATRPAPAMLPLG